MIGRAALTLMLLVGNAGAQETARPPAKPAAEAPGDDFDHSACLLGLTLLGVAYEEMAPVADAGDPQCGIPRPVRVTAIQPGIAIEGGALMRCATARRLALWTRDFVRPATARLPGTPRLTAYVPGSTYDCRPRVGGSETKISEHARGTAFDIMAVRFDNGEAMEFRPRTGDGDAAESFQQALRGTACLYFSTVLGPGSNEAHEDHLHLDLAERKGGFRLCE